MPGEAPHADATAPKTPVDFANGLVLFVESIRWLGVRWGFSSVTRGLGLAGFTGEVRYWRWHRSWRGWLVLPAIMDTALLEEEAKRLADCIVRHRREHPGSPVYLVGYSCGAYVALRAMELLPPGVKIQSAAFLAGAFSPCHDLSEALEHVEGNIVNSSSLGDCLIVGLGTILFGTADRKYWPSAGMVGLAGQQPPRVIQIRWRPNMIPLGNIGGHFTASAARYIARTIAPAMGITKNGR